MNVETAADLLTWKNAQLEENVLLEFAQQYEKLTDEEKSDLAQTAESAHREYVQEMMRRVTEPKRPRIRIDLSSGDSEGEVNEDQIQEAMGFVDVVKEMAKPKGRKMRLDTVSLSVVSATP
jgi:hypothetical protein